MVEKQTVSFLLPEIKRNNLEKSATKDVKGWNVVQAARLVVG